MQLCVWRGGGDARCKGRRQVEVRWDAHLDARTITHRVPTPPLHADTVVLLPAPFAAAVTTALLASEDPLIASLAPHVIEQEQEADALYYGGHVAVLTCSC